MHRSMSVESVIEKLQKVAKEKEVQKNEHKWRQEEEVKMLEKREAKEELRKAKSTRMLNIQPLAIRLPSHSPSSSECEKGEVYNEKMQFAHMIIQNIYKTRTFVIEFLRRCKTGWSSSVQARLIATSMDAVNIKESKEDEGVEQ